MCVQFILLVTCTYVVTGVNSATDVTRILSVFSVRNVPPLYMKYPTAALLAKSVASLLFLASIVQVRIAEKRTRT